MRAAWSYLRARVGNRLARHLRVAPAKLNNSGPMVSFTFDDAPVSAARAGADMLEQYGARGTFYIAGGLVDAWSGNWTGASAGDIVDLHRRGHEIACHTFSHTRMTDLTAAAMAAELAKNRNYLLGLDPSIKIENFAYPYGTGSVLRKGQLGAAFHSSRGILPGINSGTADLQYLRAMPLIDCEIDRDGIDRVFDEAFDKNGWLIFYSHDVETTPSPYGCSPEVLRHALDAAARRNIPAMSIAAALQFAGV
ncbi:MAG: polysaccharide deacetylase family protein [Bradyrhizobium sp.]|uniref:polysaccharide deacetylase family protein n=1 Tax=Bradyrhizobium sp. TaxID=376 RepID=UPI001C28966A|nr:polysaccharide deacetylase family protein [Pseudomonadota bacterium]MDE2067038.1 polysaccharide deacetylase family protein [Bradyrhizobium sp.]MDE2241232.1 polysaccharide deacetylase family protein [Bradyrhizobium sp.]MDE2468080.1 polysaccharide deacetylase family protein [Bradyrhizobium sp.]